MSQPQKQQMGDGNDNYAQGAKQARNAARKFGKTAGRKAAQTATTEGAKATANAAASTVKGGAKVGKLIANVAKGTAAGGPWGAIIAAAWSMRRTLYKILICVCLFVVLLVAVIVSLPDIIMQNIFDLHSSGEVVEGDALHASYNDLSVSIEEIMAEAYAEAREEAEEIMSDSKYNQELSRKHFQDNAQNSLEYNVAFILAAYSVSMEQTGTSKVHFIDRLEGVSDRMFKVNATEKTETQTVSVDGELREVDVCYVICTIERCNDDDIMEAFEIDPDAEYKNYGITNLEYVEHMARSLKQTVG